MFGSRHAEPVMLPECETTNEKQKKLTDELLSVTDRGIHFKVEAGNIVAIRKCRLVFCSLSEMKVVVGIGQNLIGFVKPTDHRLIIDLYKI